MTWITDSVTGSPGPQMGSNGATLVASPFVITQTAVIVNEISKQLVAANPGRKYLAWMVVGASDITVVPGLTPAVAGLGLIYQTGGVGKQGGSQEFPNGSPTNAFQVISVLAGTTVIVWEGV